MGGCCDNHTCGADGQESIRVDQVGNEELLNLSADIGESNGGHRRLLITAAVEETVIVHDHTGRKTSEERPNEAPDTNCCEGSQCGCDDACFDELARVICADDETHLHEHESNSTYSDTCCDSEAGGDTAVKTYEHFGVRKRSKKTVSESHHGSSKPACGTHRSIARNRYNDTLAAFGCICKALLARGLQSCCTTTTLGRSGKAVAHSQTSKRSSHRLVAGRTSHDSTRPASIDSCCDKGCCDSPARSIRSFPNNTHADARSLNGAKLGSRVSVDTCCRGGGCGGEDAQSEHTHEKGGHAIVDIEKAGALIDGHAILAIKGMTCTGCENKLIRTLGKIPTIANFKTSLVLCRAEFDFDSGATDISTLVQLIEKRSGFEAEVITAASVHDLLVNVPILQRAGFVAAAKPLGVEAITTSGKDTFVVTYQPQVIGAREIFKYYDSFTTSLAPEPLDPSIAAGAKHIRSLSLRMVISILLTIPVLVMTWAPLPSNPRGYGIASLVLATIVQTAITGPFYISSFKSLFFSRLVETELLIVLSTTTAYVYSVVAFAYEMAGQPLSTGQFFETSTLLVTLIMVGQVVSAIARQRAIEAISIRSLQARTAILLLSEGKEEVIDVRLMHYGDSFKVLPDSAIITDGEVLSGVSSVDESMMTGESRPVDKGPGDTVIAGTSNGPSPLVVKVTRLPGENTISDIARMVDDARFSRARVQEAVDWICGWFVPVVLALAIITFVVWVAVGIAVRKQSGGEAAVTALTYAVSVLAVSCPCAIGLAVPMVILIAGGVGAKLGLVFKAATTIEQARKVTHVVLDKTGTLTEGKLSVVDRFVDNQIEHDVLSIAAQLVASSHHPVARAVALASALQAISASVQDIEMVTGKGIRATFNGMELRGGSARWLELGDDPAVQPFLAQGYTIFCRSIKVSVLSGDHPAAVLATASALGIPAERVRANCLPADKQAYVKALTDAGETVLFCGDGTNDAVALAQAAIALGCGGRRIALNFAWAALYNTVAVLFAAGAFVHARIPPAYAGLGEVVSVVPVVAVALQLKWFRATAM
ncbi:heavy metal translocatin [Epithele typhae]|uniref:heavy metal translocatin n=1 Tax=Epithele typhae TaxID=378194 RepID=UPI0020072A12|nr:heavy metal translocatin [Epithele typhae]KAH9935998.1 heavy metal translocatin [Epithele typhae]